MNECCKRIVDITVKPAKFIANYNMITYKCQWLFFEKSCNLPGCFMHFAP